MEAINCSKCLAVLLPLLLLLRTDLAAKIKNNISNSKTKQIKQIKSYKLNSAIYRIRYTVYKCALISQSHAGYT